MSNTDDLYRRYWTENLQGWAGLYGPDTPDAHLENVYAGAWLRWIYARTITPIERRLLSDRLELCRSFIANNVEPGSRANDVGCGTGMLTTELLSRGALVVAIDFVEEALTATRRRVEAVCPTQADRVSYLLADVRTDVLPGADIALAIGVAPYVGDLDVFVRNAVATAGTSYCHFLDRSHWANWIRRLLPALNVRRLNYTSRADVDAAYARHGLKRIARDRLGSGFIDTITHVNT